MVSTSRLCAIALVGVLITLSLQGWGWGVLNWRRRETPDRSSDSVAPTAVVGLAAVLAVGSLFNFLHLISAVAFIAILLLGLALAVIAATRPGRWKVDTLIRIAGTTLLALPIFLRSLDLREFNPHDDAYAYLVAPKKMLDQGTLRPDPFNYRLIVSGPGGMAFLQAGAVRAFGVNAINVIDQGVGILLLAIAMAALLARWKIHWLAALILAAGLLVIMGHPVANVSSYFTMLALLLALAFYLFDAELPPIRRAVCVGLTFAAIASLKNTAVPIAAFLVTAAYVVKALDWPRSALREAVTAGVVAAAPLLLWYAPRWAMNAALIPLHHGSAGDDVSVGYMLWWIADGGAEHWRFILLFLAVGAVALLLGDRSQRRIVAGIMAALIGGSALTIYLTGGVSITRFNLPFLAIGYFLVAGQLLVILRPNKKWTMLAACLLTCGFFAFRAGPASHRWVDAYTKFLRHGRTNAIVYPPPMPPQNALRIQASMQPGAPALVWIDTPYALDFARNNLSVIDFPYAASPQPYIGSCSDESALVDYLSAMSIRYVIYSYADKANFPEATVDARLADPRFTPWQRVWNRQVPPFHRMLTEIGRDYRRVYDDGQIFVADLDSKSTEPLRRP
ncbi:hypothetical protein BH10PLA1_BH10PLA1_01780 [soil metagenome]